jgi:transposase-like protein
MLLKQNKSSFKWRRFESTIILVCVRWFCRYQLSYRDLEEMMKERGLDVDHSKVFVESSVMLQKSTNASASS